MKSAGLTRGTTHTLRHVFCSFLANNQVPAFQVMKLLRHHSLDIVLQYYHTTEEELLATVASLPYDQMLASAAGEVGVEKDGINWRISSGSRARPSGRNPSS